MLRHFVLLWGQGDHDGSFICILPFLAVWLLLMYWSVRHYFITVPALLERWAAENGFEILTKERRRFFKGPFFWTSSKNQVVYRIEAGDAKGRQRNGWVRIGGYWWPFGDKVEVRWDEPPPEMFPLDKLSSRGNPPMWDQELDT